MKKIFILIAALICLGFLGFSAMAGPIGVYAVVQWPKTITETEDNIFPDNVYGQVYIAGVTDSGADPSAIDAQLGYGTSATPDSSWQWLTAAFNPGHTGDNNYEYVTSLLVNTPGVYDYLYRFSYNAGDWIYGDQYGLVASFPASNPGILTVLPSESTSVPEPAALLLFGTGLGAIGFTKLRRRK